MAVPPSAVQCALPCHENCPRMTQGMWQRAQYVDLAPKFPRSQHWASVWISRPRPILMDALPHHTGPKRTIAKVPGARHHRTPPEVFCPFLDGSELFRKHKRNLQNIKQAYLTLWLISVHLHWFCSCLTTLAGITGLSVRQHWRPWSPH